MDREGGTGRCWTESSIHGFYPAIHFLSGDNKSLLKSSLSRFKTLRLILLLGYLKLASSVCSDPELLSAPCLVSDFNFSLNSGVISFLEKQSQSMSLKNSGRLSSSAWSVAPKRCSGFRSSKALTRVPNYTGDGRQCHRDHCAKPSG